MKRKARNASIITLTIAIIFIVAISLKNVRRFTKSVSMETKNINEIQKTMNNAVFSEQILSFENCDYEFADNGKLILREYLSDADCVIVPEKINEYEVELIAPEIFKDTTQLEIIKIPISIEKSVTEILDFERNEELSNQQYIVYSTTKDYNEKYLKYIKLTEEEKNKQELIPDKFLTPLQKTNEDNKLSVNETKKIVSPTAAEATASLPTSYDLRKYVNINVEAQSPFGICYAHATTKCVETNLALRSNIKNENLSEIHMAVMSRQGAAGWFKTVRSRYFNKGYGPVDEKVWSKSLVASNRNEIDAIAYKYCINRSSVTDAQIDKAIDYMGKTAAKYIVMQTKDFGAIDGNKKRDSSYKSTIQTQRNEVKNFIMNYGSIWAVISDINYSSVCASNGKYFVCNASTSEVSDVSSHAISIIGWDDNFDKSNFNCLPAKNRPSTNGAYLALNSWGSSWGSGGTFWISYEDFDVDAYMSGVVSVKTGKVNVSNANITLKTTSYTYDGNEKRPAITFEYEGNVYKNGTDFTVEYSNNKNAGIASVKITGIGRFTGAVTKNFSINPTNPIITRKDFNTFTYTASGAAAYYVSTTQTTAPAAGTVAASNTFTLDKWTTAKNTGDLTLEEGKIYYVWAKSSATGGTVSTKKASIAVRKITRSQGKGTTLTTRYDSTSSSSGTAFTDTSKLVLNGTPFWAKATLNTGYNTITLKHGSTVMTANGETFESSKSESITSSAIANIYKVTLNNQGATSAGTIVVWYYYNTNKNVNGVTVYYYSDSTCATPLSGGSNITIPTKTGYTFGGYYTGANGSGTQYVNASGKFINNLYKNSTENVTLYANWIANNYQNTNTSNYYETLAAAFSSVANNQTIKVLNNMTETTAPTLATGKKGIKLDMNGKTITLNNIVLTNNGTLDMYSSKNGAVLTSSANSVIKNSGELTVNGTSSLNTIQINSSATTPGARIIVNDAEKTVTLNEKVTLTYTKAIVQPEKASSRYLVSNNGTLTIKGATLINNISNTTYDAGITNGATARIIMSSGKLTTYGAGIYSTGTGTSLPAIELSGTTTETVLTSSNSHVIRNNANGTIKISGGSISSTSSQAIRNSLTGAIEVSGGTISGTNGICNEAAGKISISGSSTNITGTTATGIRGYVGEVKITGGTISGKTDGIYLTTVDNSSGTAIVTGGTVTGERYGVNVDGSSILTMGTKDSSVSITSPIVQSTGTTRGVGVYIEGATGKFNFYDGKVVARASKSINRTETDKQNGYEVHKSTTNNIETAVLRLMAPTITRTDYNTFKYSGEGAVAYYVSTSNAKPKAGASQKEFALDKWTTATNTGSLTLEEKNTTYYVWAENATTGGMVSESTSITIEAKKLSNIEITTKPAKTEYLEGENFNSNQMKVVAIYNDTTSKEIDNYIVTDGNNLSIEKTSVTISYTEGNITKTTTQKIKVLEKLKINFENYNEINENGKKYIENIRPGTTIEEFTNKIKTNGTIQIFKDNKEIIDNKTNVSTGMKIKIYLNKENCEYIIVVRGDTNGDGECNLKDLLQVNKHRLNKTQLKEEYLLAGDVNKDDIVNIKDILQINKFRLGKSEI